MSGSEVESEGGKEKRLSSAGLTRKGLDSTCAILCARSAYQFGGRKSGRNLMRELLTMPENAMRTSDGDLRATSLFLVSVNLLRVGPQNECRA